MRAVVATLAMLGALSAPVLAAEVVDVADLVEKQGPAVVNISTTKLTKRGPNGMPFDMPNDENMQEFFRRFFPGMPGGPGGQGGPMQEMPTHGRAPASSSAATAPSSPTRMW